MQVLPGYFVDYHPSLIYQSCIESLIVIFMLFIQVVLPRVPILKTKPGFTGDGNIILTDDSVLLDMLIFLNSLGSDLEAILLPLAMSGYSVLIMNLPEK